MKLTRAQKKAKLEAKANAIIEALLDWDEKNGAPKLVEIEDEVLELRQRFGQEMAAVVIEGQEVRQPAENPPCPTCGKEMRYKGQKGKDVESRLGGLKVKRGNYYCTDCKSGLFPPGQAI
jgi:hypothetical protein